MTRLSFPVVAALSAVWALADAAPASAQNYYNPFWRPGPVGYVSPYPGQRWVGPVAGPNRVFYPTGRGQMVPIAGNASSLRYNLPPTYAPRPVPMYAPHRGPVFSGPPTTYFPGGSYSIPVTGHHGGGSLDQ